MEEIKLFSNMLYHSEIEKKICDEIISRCSGISHIDPLCSIFHLDGDTKNSYKFVLDPNTKKQLPEYLSSIVKRGIKYQYRNRDLDCVQDIASPDFYQGINGVIGPLQFIEGENLKNIKKINEPKKRLAQFQRLEKTLKELHRNKIMHRDIKSGNIIESKDGSVKLIDFSIASSFEEDMSESLKGWMMGTISYLHCDPRRSKDFYGLGVSYLESITKDITLPIIPNEKSIKEFEKNSLKILLKLYGSEISDYFSHLINMPSEYKRGEIDKRDEIINLEDNIFINGLNTTVLDPQNFWDANRTINLADLGSGQTIVKNKRNYSWSNFF